jgi:hypothetical protein
MTRRPDPTTTPHAGFVNRNFGSRNQLSFGGMH